MKLFLTQSKAVQQVLEDAMVIAKDPSPVLIEGETGTGKSHLAKMIHAFSERKGQCVQFGCGEVHAGLATSMFFGHVKGSFTGATESKEGLLSVANNGTLILDDIDYLDFDTQGKLTVFLDEGHFYKIGDYSKRTNANVRIIATTNKNLNELIVQGDFKNDLFYRIGIFNFKLPPLRHRPEDIEYFSKLYLAEICNGAGISKKLTNDAIIMLHDYEWPGNFRELYAVIKRAVYFTGHKKNIEHNDLIKLIPFEKVNPFFNRKAINKHELYSLLMKHNWNISQVSRATNLARNTIYRLIESNGWQR